MSAESGRPSRGRDRVLGIGFPFAVHASANSTRKPRLFDWTDDPAAATTPVTVCMAGGIMRAIDHPGPKIAWITESPAIAAWQNITPTIKARLDEMLDAYEVLLTADRELCLLDSRIVYHPAGSNLPWVPEESYGLYPKTRLCSMFASPKVMVDGHRYRQEVATRLRGELDLYGGAAGSERIGGGGAHPDKRAGLEPYMFSVTMENCRTPLYYTEKLTDCFATGTVPVYWGTEAIGEVFDTDGIIPLDDDFRVSDLSAERYESMLPAIQRNLALVRALEGSDDLLYRRFVRNRV